MWALIPIAWRFAIVGITALAVIGTSGAIYYKIGHNAVLRERAKIEQEKQHAIERANAAKERLRALCADAPDKCLPDDWLRD